MGHQGASPRVQSVPGTNPSLLLIHDQASRSPDHQSQGGWEAFGTCQSRMTMTKMTMMRKSKPETSTESLEPTSPWILDMGLNGALTTL